MEIFVLIVVAAVFTFVGVLLGRRSKMANIYADRILADLDALKERIEAYERGTDRDA